MARNIKKEKEWAKTKYVRVFADLEKDLAEQLKEKLKENNTTVASWMRENAKKYLEE